MILIFEMGNGKDVVDQYLGNNYVRRDPFCPYIVKASEKGSFCQKPFLLPFDA